MSTLDTCNLPPAVWDNLAGSQVTVQHGWLKALEAAEHSGADTALLDPAGRWGAAVCYEARDRRCGLDPSGLLLGRLAGPRGAWASPGYLR